MLGFQLPRYEHLLTRDDAELVGRYLRRWGGPAWVAGPEFADYERRCRTAGRPSSKPASAESRRRAARSEGS